ncbi:hypothetical protein [Pararhizobium arenae]|uniref:hypothetical protein n=1 Tax=Pararhizobium arenae TaxID=1856850 RepID=UPI00094AFC74|nr:hypothetical protein [Pararhizobium arenae]
MPPKDQIQPASSAADNTDQDTIAPGGDASAPGSDSLGAGDPTADVTAPPSALGAGEQAVAPPPSTETQTESLQSEPPPAEDLPQGPADDTAALAVPDPAATADVEGGDVAMASPAHSRDFSSLSNESFVTADTTLSGEDTEGAAQGTPAEPNRRETPLAAAAAPLDPHATPSLADNALEEPATDSVAPGAASAPVPKPANQQGGQASPSGAPPVAAQIAAGDVQTQIPSSSAESDPVLPASIAQFPRAADDQEPESSIYGPAQSEDVKAGKRRVPITNDDLRAQHRERAETQQKNLELLQRNAEELEEIKRRKIEGHGSKSKYLGDGEREQQLREQNDLLIGAQNAFDKFELNNPASPESTHGTEVLPEDTANLDNETPIRPRFMAGDQRGWLAHVTRLNIDPLSPSQFEAAKEHADKTIQMLLSSEPIDENAIVRFYRATSLYGDMTGSKKFLDILRSLPADGLTASPTVLEALGAEIATMRRLINPPSSSMDSESEAAKLIRSKGLAAITRLESSVAHLAVDSTSASRAWTLALSASCTALPFLAGAYHDPKSYFYMSQAAGAYARTATIGIGLMQTTSTDKRTVMEYTVYRQVLWCLPFVLYFATTFGPKFDPSFKDKAKETTKNIPFVAMMGFTSFLGYLGMLHAQKINFLRKKWGLTIDAAEKLYARGEMEISELSGLVANVDEEILSHLKQIEGYTDIISKASDDYQKEDSIAYGLATQLKNYRADVESLKTHLSLVCEPVKTYLEEKQEEGNSKALVATVMIAATIGIAAVQGIAAKTDILYLTDMMPWQAIVLGTLVKSGYVDTFSNMDDFLREWANLCVGSLFSLPPAIANLVAQEVTGKSLFDLSLNTADSPFKPFGTNVAFSAFTVYSVVVNLLFSTKAGPYIALKLIAALTQSKKALDGIFPPEARAAFVEHLKGHLSALLEKLRRAFPDVEAAGRDLETLEEGTMRLEADGGDSARIVELSEDEAEILQAALADQVAPGEEESAPAAAEVDTAGRTEEEIRKILQEDGAYGNDARQAYVAANPERPGGGDTYEMDDLGKANSTPGKQR